VKTYLKKFAFSNADMNDLIKVVSDNFNNVNLCGDLTYREFLLDFLTQPYYPVVTIEVSEELPAFTQHSINSTRTDRWNIPLFVWDSDSNKKQVYWLLRNGSLCYPSGVKEPTIGLIYNYEGRTFAQIQYSSTYWEDLVQLNYSNVDEQTIFGLLMDLTPDENLKTPSGANIVLNRFVKKVIADLNGLLPPQIIGHLLTVLPDTDVSNN
jgi:aminopeptidase N